MLVLTKVLTQPIKLSTTIRVPPFTSHSADRKITNHAAEAPKRERRQKLLELVQAKFPDGNVLMPYIEPSAVPADSEITDYVAEAAECERCRKLLELAKATVTFLDGNVPMPYLASGFSNADYCVTGIQSN